MGLIGHWKLNNDAGNTAGKWLDSTPNEYHCTGSGTPTSATDRHGDVGGAVTIVRASSQFVSVADADALELKQVSGFSISAWFKASSGATFRGIASKWKATTDQRAFALVLRSSDTVSLGVSGNGIAATEIVSSATFADNQWHNIVGVLDTAGGVLRLYVDGVSVATSVGFTGNMFDSTEDFKIGTFDANYFDGDIQDVRYHNIALGLDETEALYLESKPNVPGTIGLLDRIDSGDVTAWTTITTGGTVTATTFLNDEMMLLDTTSAAAVASKRSFTEPNTDYLVETDMHVVSGSGVLKGIVELLDASNTVLCTVSLDGGTTPTGSFFTDTVGATAFTYVADVSRMITFRVNTETNTVTAFITVGIGTAADGEWTQIATKSYSGTAATQISFRTDSVVGTKLYVNEVKIYEPNLFICGDSHMAGGGDSTETWNAFPNASQRQQTYTLTTHSIGYKLGLKFQTQQWVANRGVGGEGYGGLDSHVVSDVILQGARICVLGIGANNITTSTSAQILAGIDKIVSKFLSADIKVLLLNMPPRSDWSAADNIIRDEVNVGLEQRADRNFVKIVDFYNAVVDPADPDLIKAEFAAVGGIHLSSAGQQAVADAAYTEHITDRSSLIPMGYYKLDDNAGNGTWVDSANVFNYDLVGTNTPTGATGVDNIANSAANFVIANVEYMDRSGATSTGFNFEGTYSLTAWVKIGADGTLRLILSKWNPTGNQKGYAFYVDANDKIGVGISSTGADATNFLGDVGMSQGVWHFLVAIHNAEEGVIKLFVDNVAATTPDPYTSGVFSGTGPFAIGALIGGIPFGGDIDNVRVYAKALSPSERTFLFNEFNVTSHQNMQRLERSFGPTQASTLGGLLQ